MSGKTPGQAAYEAWWANRPPVTGTATAIPADWDGERPAVRAQWETAAFAAAAPVYDQVAELVSEGNSLREQLNAARAEIEQLKARLADGGAEHPSCDVHRWYAVVKHYGSFAYGFAATENGLRVWDDAGEFEHAKAEDFA